MKIKGKNVIITGGASGVGKELTKQMLKCGCNVASIDINEENLKKLKEELDSKRLKTYVVDMADVESIKRFRENYKKDYSDAATKSILNIKYRKFSDIVGKEFDVNGYKVIPIYHPSPISPMSYKGNIDIIKNIKIIKWLI